MLLFSQLMNLAQAKCTLIRCILVSISICWQTANTRDKLDSSYCAKVIECRITVFTGAHSDSSSIVELYHLPLVFMGLRCNLANSSAQFGLFCLPVSSVNIHIITFTTRWNHPYLSPEWHRSIYIYTVVGLPVTNQIRFITRWTGNAGSANVFGKPERKDFANL